jgi:Flp pilus assembly pilin Flp
MKALGARFLGEDSGQDLIEYGLLVGIITTATITAISAVGDKVQQYFVNLNSLLPTR